MDESENALISIGLTPTEARLYLAGLSADTISVQELGQKTQIKRPTIYHAISTLVEKGLVLEKRVRNRSFFCMAAPENIRGLIERQREKLDKQAGALDLLIPHLEQQRSSASRDGVSVANYNGIEGMKMVMDIAFYCRSKKWDVIAPYKNFLREYDKEYARRYLSARKYHGITSRTLWEDAGPASRKLTAEEKSERDPRLMPWVMHGKFKSMMILFDDKIAIFSSYDKLSAILITSAELHAMFQAMFDGIWEISEQY